MATLTQREPATDLVAVGPGPAGRRDDSSADAAATDAAEDPRRRVLARAVVNLIRRAIVDPTTLRIDLTGVEEAVPAADVTGRPRAVVPLRPWW